jgi:uncharacterized protein
MLLAFGQWRAARRLVERAAVPTLWQAAALGLIDRVEYYFATDSRPLPKRSGCVHGGQQRAAEYLLARGADLNQVGSDANSR